MKHWRHFLHIYFLSYSRSPYMLGKDPARSICKLSPLLNYIVYQQSTTCIAFTAYWSNLPTCGSPNVALLRCNLWPKHGQKRKFELRKDLSAMAKETNHPLRHLPILFLVLLELLESHRPRSSVFSDIPYKANFFQLITKNMRWRHMSYHKEEKNTDTSTTNCRFSQQSYIFSCVMFEGNPLKNFLYCVRVLFTNFPNEASFSYFIGTLQFPHWLLYACNSLIRSENSHGDSRKLHLKLTKLSFSCRLLLIVDGFPLIAS